MRGGYLHALVLRSVYLDEVPELAEREQYLMGQVNGKAWHAQTAISYVPRWVHSWKISFWSNLCFSSTFFLELVQAKGLNVLIIVHIITQLPTIKLQGPITNKIGDVYSGK